MRRKVQSNKSNQVYGLLLVAMLGICLWGCNEAPFQPLTVEELETRLLGQWQAVMICDGPDGPCDTLDDSDVIYSYVFTGDSTFCLLVNDVYKHWGYYSIWRDMRVYETDTVFFPGVDLLVLDRKSGISNSGIPSWPDRIRLTGENGFELAREFDGQVTKYERSETNCDCCNPIYWGP